MKKILGIIVLGLLLSGNAYAKTIKPGSGKLELFDETIEMFHIYLTEKFNDKTFKKAREEKRVQGMSSDTSKPRYANHFLIWTKYFGYIFVADGNLTPDTQFVFGCDDVRSGCKIFARGNKIVWQGAKKKISRKVSLEELRLILEELGFKLIGKMPKMD